MIVFPSIGNISKLLMYICKDRYGHVEKCKILNYNYRKQTYYPVLRGINNSYMFFPYGGNVLQPLRPPSYTGSAK